MARIRIAPQPGPQERFASCTADIAFYGGQAGGGKTYALLLEAMKWVQWPGYDAVIFRRNQKDLTAVGSIWSEAKQLYRKFGGTPREGQYIDVKWDNAAIQFAHLHQEDDVFNYQGRQLAFAGFDEVTHFTEKQFWYIWTRLRTTCGIRPYMRATCNPDPDSFVAKLISWWIGPDGYPIPERDGVLRWTCLVGDDRKWFDSEQECKEYLVSIGDVDQSPISITFIRSRLEDNKALIDAQPDYKGKNIASQDSVTRARLGDGNWLIRERSGGMFDRTWFNVIDELPDQSQWQSVVRAWDKAGTKPNPQNEDPDWTRGVKGIRLKNGQVVICDLISTRSEPGHVDALTVSTALADGPNVVQAYWRDGGQSGKVDEMHTTDLLRKKCPNVRVVWEGETKSKEQYAKPFASFCDPEANSGLRMVSLLRAPWNAEFLAELERFPKPKGVNGEHIHDDIVDACSRMFLELQKGKTGNVSRFMQAMTAARP